MKKLLLFLALIPLLLAGCEEKEDYRYVYSGEGEYWQAEYIYEGTEIWRKEGDKHSYSNSDSYNARIVFKGSADELSALGELEYSFDAGSRGASHSAQFDAPPESREFTVSGGSRGGAKLREDEVIYVTVRWDGMEESFQLHNEKGK